MVLQSTAVEPELLPESLPELEPPSVPPEVLPDEELVEDPLELVDPLPEDEPPELPVALSEPEASSPPEVVPVVDGLLLLLQPPTDEATPRPLPARIVAIKTALIVLSSFRIAALRALSRPAAPKVLMICDYLFSRGG
jgi:hypothetical protein